jgi:DNA repair photolyase|tara:strand:- start:868 stop:2064 length:1197 start_codon:yes stop_codon:yes gene_type:complete
MPNKIINGDCMMELKKRLKNFETFNPLNVSSKFAICGLPLRVDSYKTCSFGCKYCFANCRKVMEFEKKVKIANINSMKNKLEKIYVKKEYNKKSFLDYILRERITWHWGGMSDPFQPIEKTLKVTSQMLEITNRHNISILFSTKSDDVYDWRNLNPQLHSFQMSISSLEDRKEIEPFVPNMKNRIKFYKKLKAKGFKVGIRVQPFIPKVTKSNIVDEFKDADYFTIEGLKLVPQNKEHKEYLLKILNISREDFLQKGLLNLKPEIRVKLYKNFIEKLEKFKIPYSLADNDLHHISSSKCCCGEPLIKKSTNFNNTALFFKNPNYNLEDVKRELGNCADCVVNHLFTSNRQEGCKTITEFYDKRFDRKTSPFSKKYIYNFHQKDLLDYEEQERLINANS